MVRIDSQYSKIEGGFIAVPVAALMSVWRSSGSSELARADFRTWLAAHEMVARRAAIKPECAPVFRLAELARLLGGLTERRVRSSIRRLSAAGFLVFGTDRIEFPKAPELVEKLDVIGKGRGALVIPRRLLRFLVAEARPTIIATAIAYLLRCLSRRKNGFDGRGRVKASWIAEQFGIDLRTVKAARAELLQLGWIDPEPSGQILENRWGRAFRINLAWERSRGAVSPPPPPVPRRDFATPSSHLDPLREKIQHQEPASPPGTGFRIETRREPRPDPTVTPVLQTQVAAQPVPEPAKLPAPRLDDIRSEDLRETSRLLELHRQAVTRRLVGSSDGDRLKFVALAEHARNVGRSNPPGLFAALLRRGAWSFITQAEEDSARRKLKAELWGPSVGLISVLASPVQVRPMLSDDARLVREIKRSLAASGYRGDAFPQLRRIDPSWTRARWDAASSEFSPSRNGLS